MSEGFPSSEEMPGPLHVDLIASPKETKLLNRDEVDRHTVLMGILRAQ